jgi:ribosome recycling factor
MEIRDAKETFNSESNELSRQIIHEKVTLENESGAFRKRLAGEIHDRASKLVGSLKKEIHTKNVALVENVRTFENQLKQLTKEKHALEDENRKLKREFNLDQENVIEYAREGMYNSRDVS